MKKSLKVLPKVSKEFKALAKGPKSTKKLAKTKSKLPVFKAPSEMKPFFLLVTLATEKDGLLAGKIKATRFKGRFDPEADAKKKSELAAYDVGTLLALQARIAAVTYKTTPDRKYPKLPKERNDLKGSHRLPASTTFDILLRVGRSVTTQELKIGVKFISQHIEHSKTGRVRPVELAKTDPVYRMIRKAARILPAAFQNVQEPPKKGSKNIDLE